MPFISSVRGSFGPQGRFGRRGLNIITDRNLYPTSASNYQLFTTAWDANDTNLTNPNHAASTFTVPTNVDSIRVLVWGSGCTQIGSAADPGNGGFIDTVLQVTPGDKYKVIVGGGGTAFSGYGGLGSNGIGGGAAQDGNDIGSGGAGSGFFYAFNSSNTIVSTEVEMFSKGCLIAGGGGTYAGHGMSGSQNNITFSGVSGVGREGGRGANNGGFGGLTSGQGGTSVFDANGNTLRVGGTDGNGGQYGQDAYGANYGNGSGGGRGAGGGSSGQGSGGGINGENATGTGGRGGVPASSYNSSGFGRGGTGPGGGGNGSIFNGIRLGGGGGGSHGSPAGGGGWSGGAGSYCCANQGGGGGSGVAFGSIITPTLSGWVNPNTVSVKNGNANSICGVPTTSGAGRIISGTGYSGAVLVMW